MDVLQAAADLGKTLPAYFYEIHGLELRPLSPPPAEPVKRGRNHSRVTAAPLPPFSEEERKSIVPTANQVAAIAALLKEEAEARSSKRKLSVGESGSPQKIPNDGSVLSNGTISVNFALLQHDGQKRILVTLGHGIVTNAPPLVAFIRSTSAPLCLIPLFGGSSRSDDDALSLKVKFNGTEDQATEGLVPA